MINKAAAPDTDQSFEARFADLARQTLQDRAPSASPHEIGFQLIDRNDEGSKACGVFGLALGARMAYAPIFFLDGETFADHLVYTDPDLFVPLSDDWIESALRRDSGDLGEGVDRVKARFGLTRPNLRAILDPTFKRASEAIPEAMLPVTTAFAQAVADGPPKGPHQTFPEAVRKMGKEGYRAFAKLAYYYPAFVAALDKVHGEGTAASLTDEAGKAWFTAQPAPVKVANNFEAFLGNATPPNIAAPQPNAQPSATANPAGGESVTQNFRDWTENNLAFHHPAMNQAPSALMSSMHKKQHTGPRDDVEAQLAVKEAEYGKHGTPGPLEEMLSEKEKPSQKPPTKLKFPAGHSGLRTSTMKMTSAKKMAGFQVPDKELQDVARQGYYVEDLRKEASEVVMLDDKKFQIRNPNRSGVYDVLTPSGFKELVVLNGGFALPRPLGGNSVVFEKDGGKSTTMRTQDIWVRSGVDEDEVRKLKEWVEGKEAATSMPDSEGKYVMVDPGGRVIAPFCLYERESERSACVSFDEKPRSWTSSRTQAPDDSRGDTYGTIRFTGRDGRSPGYTRDDLLIPNGFRVIKLSDENNLDLATRDDVKKAIFEKTAAVNISVDRDGVYTIDGQRMSRPEAAVHLMQDWGLREKAAVELCKKASVHVQEYRVLPPSWLTPELVKEAYGGGAFAPPFPIRQYQMEDTPLGGIVSQQPEYTAAEGDPGPGRPPDPYPIPHGMDNTMTPNVMAQSLAAAGQGRKEVFDTSAIGAMLNESNATTEVERSLGDLLKAVDRLGRDLFFARWDREAFEDRYGAKDAPALEDMLRTNYEKMGDLVLKLRQRQVGPGGLI